ncbi:hypothetical protein CERZMDRAFT_100658 [Cercospora zeae-maydis SCOH1-5]|uniref:O-methyltransferase domain-containing protein n=1 Tax=Cercospora zeae-maydis SCOH1-5 TaxID=717836 RepID=A0A6A6F8B0_9PEZI|nr:hypothetical protein CERZMDRAFT_100658 [Cercospora zeae-maydis SCOH1-5]
MTDAPETFLWEIIKQAQLLACLKWLSKFEILAIVPAQGQVSYQDAADLADVSVEQLSRIVRFTATSGFLRETESGMLAHSRLSTEFAEKSSLLDATSFICDTAVPTSLRMADATRRNAVSQHSQHCAFQFVSPQSVSLQRACEDKPRLQRELAAFQSIQDTLIDQSTADVLLSSDWAKLRVATVVEVGARSTSTAYALAQKAPELHVIVQLREDAARQQSGPKDIALLRQTAEGRVEVQERLPGSPQTIQDAAVYVLHFPGPSLTAPFSSLREHILRDLRVHFNVLRTNRSATLILVVRLLPDPAQHNDPDREAAARVQDLLLMQMANEREWDLQLLMELLDEVSDATGRMVITHNHSSREKHAAVVLEVQIRPRSTNGLRVLGTL